MSLQKKENQKESRKGSQIEKQVLNITKQKSSNNKSKNLVENSKKKFLKRKLLISIRPFKWFVFLIFTILILLIIFTDIFKKQKNDFKNIFYKKLADIGFVLEDVEIYGNNYLTKEEVKNELYKNINIIVSKDSNYLDHSKESSIEINSSKDDKVSLYQIDRKKLKRLFLKHEWILDIDIIYLMPSKIILKINEVVPFGLWRNSGDLYLIDKFGNKITSKKRDLEYFAKLPYIKGENGNIYAWRMINDILEVVDDDIFEKIAYFEFIGKRRWNIYFKNQMLVKMPEYNFKEAYILLVNMQNNENIYDKYKIIDLRVEDKLYLLPKK